MKNKTELVFIQIDVWFKTKPVYNPDSKGNMWTSSEKEIVNKDSIINAPNIELL